MSNLKRMMNILNANSSHRKYTVKTIDMGDSGYYRINKWFDVEINPSCIPRESLASVFLWCCYTSPDEGTVYRSVANVRRIKFDEVDGIVSQWAKEIKQKKLISYKAEQLDCDKLYECCQAPNKPVK